MTDPDDTINAVHLYHDVKGDPIPGARIELAKALLPIMLSRQKELFHSDRVEKVPEVIDYTLKIVNEVFNNTGNKGVAKAEAAKEAANEATKEAANEATKEAAAAEKAQLQRREDEAERLRRDETAAAEAKKEKKSFLSSFKRGGGRKTRSTSRGGRKTRRRR